MSSRFRIIVAIGLVVSLFAASLSAAAQEDDNDNGDPPGDFDIHAYEFDEPEFYGVWERTDYPVEQLEVARTWLWGPAANTQVFEEEYAEADDGMREVQYGDKSRMERHVPGSAAAAQEEDSPWQVTQGLLASELLTGELQLGDDTFEQYEPADIPIAGDGDDELGPTYAAMNEYIDWNPRTGGATITQIMDSDGVITDEDRLADYGVIDEYYVEQTDHNIASVFWDFMNSETIVYDDGEFVEGDLFLNAFYAVGFPITEAYWVESTVAGVEQDVLVQCFERRCLTYAPDNPEGWEVESGNIGLHYYNWRYNIIDDEDPIDPEPELSLALAQDDDVNEFGTDHEFTATLTENGTDVNFDDDDNIFVTIERGDDELDHDDINLDISTDDNVATLTYQGPDVGTDDVEDTINVSVDIDGETVHGEPTLTKTWTDVDDPPTDPELSLALDPTEATNTVGTEFNLTATVEENGDAQAIEEVDDVSITVARGDDDNVDVDENIALTDGAAVITYTGPEDPAEDTITVTVDFDGENLTATATKAWIPEDPDPELSLALAQEDDVNDFGTIHEFTATLTENGDDVDIENEDDVTVTIERNGEELNLGEGDVPIDVEGNVATLTYEGPDEPAVDVIDVTVTVDDDEVEADEPLTKFWVPDGVADAAPVDLDEGDVEEQTATNEEQFVDPPFTYYVLRNLPDFQQMLYYEPERLGNEVYELAGSTVGSYWLGVSAPDTQGMQSHVLHQGHVFMYLEVDDDEWVSLIAEFDDEGNLLNVNGIEPQEP